MSLGARLSELFRRGPAPDGDPTATLDASFEAQTAALQQSRRGIADVVTSRKRVELQLRRLHEQGRQLTAQAQEAVDSGAEDTARALLLRREGLAEQAALLEPDAARLRDQEDRLQAQVARLEAKVEAFRSQRETLKAQQSAAGAHVRIVEAQAGLSEEGADVGLALQRARERTEALQARAEAAEELSRDDALALPGESAGESAQRRVAAMQQDAGGGVEAELARMRAGRSDPRAQEAGA
jgi:phage shock protein A